MLVAPGFGDEEVTLGQVLANSRRGDVKETWRPRSLCRGGCGYCCYLCTLTTTCSPGKPFRLTPSCDLCHGSSSELILSSFYLWGVKTITSTISELDLHSEYLKVVKKLHDSPCSPLGLSFPCLLDSHFGACEVWIRAEPLLTRSPGGAVGSQNLHPCCPPPLTVAKLAARERESLLSCCQRAIYSNFTSS